MHRGGSNDCETAAIGCGCEGGSAGKVLLDLCDVTLSFLPKAREHGVLTGPLVVVDPGLVLQFAIHELWPEAGVVSMTLVHGSGGTTWQAGWLSFSPVKLIPFSSLLSAS